MIIHVSDTQSLVKKATDTLNATFKELEHKHFLFLNKSPCRIWRELNDVQLFTDQEDTSNSD